MGGRKNGMALRYVETLGHLSVVLVVVICTTIMALDHVVGSEVIIGLFGAAIGYSGGAVSRTRGWEDGRTPRPQATDGE